MLVNIPSWNIYEVNKSSMCMKQRKLEKREAGGFFPIKHGGPRYQIETDMNPIIGPTHSGDGDVDFVHISL